MHQVTLEVDGQTHILRARLGDMLKQLLQRQPRKFELDAWFTHFDYERTPLMGVDEYMRVRWAWLCHTCAARA